MEEHLWPQESFITHIDLDGLSSTRWFMHILLEFVGKVIISVGALLFLIKLFEFLHKVLADIAVFLFDSSGDFEGVFTWHGLLSVTELTQDELGDVSTSERDMLDTAADDEAIRHWEDVGYTISRVDDHARKIMLRKIGVGALWSSDLGIECEDGLDTNEETLYAKSLEHDFRNLLPVFWRIKRWLSKDEPVLLWLTSEIRINRFVPELLDTFPVFDLTSSKKIADLMGFLVRHGLISDVVVHLITFKFCVFLKKVYI